MNFGIFKLTFEQRKFLAVFSTVLCFIEFLLGAFITGGSIYVVVTISPRFYSEKAEITFVFTVTGMFGTHVIITYLIGIKICDKCYNFAHKKSTGRHLQVWLLSSCNTAVNIVILTYLSAKIAKHIVRSLKHSLEKGVHNYLKDADWKYAIDRWQFMLQCCGVTEYKDWHRSAWIDHYHVNIENDLIKEFRLSKEHLYLPVVPWSCCRIDFPMQCFHDPIQQVTSKHLWTEQPNLILDSINNEGCHTVLRRPIEQAISIFILITIVIIILQAILLVLLRLLYTSCKSSIILGDPEGVSPGWIFTRRGIGERKDRTLSEILIDLGVPREAIARYQVFQEKKESSITATSAKKSKFGIFSNISKHFMRKKQVSKTNASTTPTSDVEPVSSGDEEALMMK